MMGLEPATYGLQNRCSTIELHRQILLFYIIKDKANCQVLIFTFFICKKSNFCVV